MTPHPSPPPPAAARKILSCLKRYSEEYAGLGDLAEEYRQIALQRGKRRAALWYWGQVLFAVPSCLSFHLSSGGTMFGNTIKIALRNMQRHKFFAGVNIAGLSIGMTCCLLIFIYVRDELRHDDFFLHGDRIYRVLAESRESGRSGTELPAVMLDQMLTDIPEIELGVRLYDYGDCVIGNGDSRFVENRFEFTAPEFFEIYSIPTAIGDPGKSLAAPFSVVLTRKSADKYFPGINPVGQVLSLDNSHDFTVTGIVENPPLHSHLRFDFLASISSLRKMAPRIMEDWNYWFTNMYLRLPPGSNPRNLEARMEDFIIRHRGREFAGKVRHRLQPLQDIHLRSGNIDSDFSSSGDIAYVYGFSAIAVFVLLIACINFINLATARSSLRAREVGIRKVSGAHRSHILLRFMGESLITTGAALGLALVLTGLMLPVFNRLAGKSFRLDLLTDPALLMPAGLILLFVTILAGLYPGTRLSGYQPVQVLGGRIPAGRSGGKPGSTLFRKALVVFQFAVSIFLISATLLLTRQMTYMQRKDMGFQRERLVVIRNPADDNSRMLLRYKRFKAAAAQLAGVEGVSAASDVPPGGIGTALMFRKEEDSPQQALQLETVWVDTDYFDLIGADFLSGRNFSRGFETDRAAIVLNEAAVFALALEDPCSSRIALINSPDLHGVIGVVRDIHHESLRRQVKPVVFRLDPFRHAQNLVIRIKAQAMTDSMRRLEDLWADMAPEWPFQYEFMSQKYERLYRKESRMKGIVRIFTGLAIFIACLGLLGLASFSIARRSREIGVRKVLGASGLSIVRLLSWESVTLVFAANLLAWPATAYVSFLWLRNFAYRVGLDVWIFLISGGISIGIALLTIGFQAVRASRANPARILRCE